MRQPHLDFTEALPHQDPPVGALRCSVNTLRALPHIAPVGGAQLAIVEILLRLTYITGGHRAASVGSLRDARTRSFTQSWTSQSSHPTARAPKLIGRGN